MKSSSLFPSQVASSRWQVASAAGQLLGCRRQATVANDSPSKLQVSCKNKIKKLMKSQTSGTLVHFMSYALFNATQILRH